LEKTMAATNALAGRFVTGDTPRSGLKGRARMMEIAAANAVEIRGLVAGLLEGIGRPPTVADEIAAEVIASTVVRGRRQRENGHSDAMERRALPALMRAWPPSSQPRPDPRAAPTATEPGSEPTANAGANVGGTNAAAQ